MKKNKLWLLLAAFAAVVLVLAACGGNDEPEPTPEPAAPQETVTPDPTPEPDPEPAELEGTITFSWWGNEGRHNATQEIAQLFMDENPGVTILFDYGAWGGWQDHMTTSLMGGVEADLMQLNFNWLHLFSPFGDTFADLRDPAIAAHLDLSNFTAADLDVTSRNGVLQAVPSGMTARVPFLRADIFNAAGIDVQDVNTWDDLMAAGQAIQAYHGDDTFALSPLGRASLAYMVFSYLEQFTGRQLIDANNQFNYSLEELTRAFELVERMVENGVLAQPGEAAINAQNPRWIEGHYAGVSEWCSSINGWINNLAADNPEGLIEVRPHFTMDGALLSGFMARPSMVFGISRNSAHPDVAAAFLNFFFTDPRAVAIQGTDRGVPANLAGLAIFESMVAAGDIGGAAVEANNIVQNAQTTTMTSVFEFPVVRDLWEFALERVQTGVETAEEAAQFVYENVQAEIDEFLN
jgi:oligogalacturonide transport system substrate-binding protein